MCSCIASLLQDNSVFCEQFCNTLPLTSGIETVVGLLFLLPIYQFHIKVHKDEQIIFSLADSCLDNFLGKAVFSASQYDWLHHM